MKSTKYFCDVCPGGKKEIAQKRAEDFGLDMRIQERGKFYISGWFDLCPVCQRNFKEMIKKFFKRSPFEWQKEK